MKKLLSFSLLGLAATPVRAEIALDFEKDPIPYVQLQGVVPRGFEVKDPTDAGLPNLFADIFDAGSKDLDRQAFLDRLAAYGASASFVVSNQYSYWTLSFPFETGRSYGDLIDVLAAQWSAPRFTNETFGLAKLKLESALKGGLDSDGSLGISTLRRFLNRRYYGGTPVTMDIIAKLTPDRLPTIWSRDFQGAPDIFAGAVAPAESEPVLRDLLQRVFAKQGKIRVLDEPRKLEVAQISTDRHLREKTFLILDKPARTQSYLSVMAVPKEHLDEDREIAFQFGNHVLLDSGLGSVFGDEIRNQRGLAYAVGSAPRFYLGFPALGVVTNPVREKSAVALDLVASLVKRSFENGEILKQMPDEIWRRHWKSFVYGRALDTSTAAGRQSERVAVATGTMGLKAYRSELDGDRPMDRDDVIKALRGVWEQSAVWASVVGDAKELQPLVKKAFPDFKVRVIPYRDTVQSKVYE